MAEGDPVANLMGYPEDTAGLENAYEEGWTPQQANPDGGVGVHGWS